MKAPKNIELKLPEDIENVESNMMQFRIAESRNAYLNLIKKKSIEYYKSQGEFDEQLSQYNLAVIDQAIEELRVNLEKERRDNKPLGYMFNEEVIELELDMYDTIEDQIEYLKRKIRDFDTQTINVDTNEYNDIKDKLKQLILSRYSLLKNKNCDWDDFIFDGLWDEIVDSHFDPYRINNAIDRVGRNKAEKFRDFIKENFNRFTIDEWMREYDTKNKLSKIDGFNKDERLTELERHLKVVNVWNEKFLDGNLGKETLNRLKLFEKKFVKDSSTKDNDKEIIYDVRPELDDYPLFEFNLLQIIEYAESMEQENTLNYLKNVYDIAKKSQDFASTLDKLTFENGLRQFIYEYQLKKDLKEGFNYSKFKTYGFEISLIIEYAKSSNDIIGRVKYYEYILREYDLIINNINFLTKDDKSSNFIYCEDYNIIHREALMYGLHKENTGNGEMYAEMNIYLLDEKKNLSIVANRIKEELEFTLQISNSSENGEIVEMDEAKIEEIKIINTDKNIDVNIDESELTVGENEKQREKIKQFLLANYSDFETNHLLNVNGIAYEITDFYYPKLNKPERKKKKESIRQELMLVRNGKIPLK